MTRILQTEHGELVVSVTSAMPLVKQLLGEPPDSYGPPALAKIHALEGTACHAVCLDWLAYREGWLPEWTVPVCPPEHGQAARWTAVLHAALRGFQEFCAAYQVVPYGIEHQAVSRSYSLVGHIDLLAELVYKTRTVKAIIDLKFVRAVQESHHLQIRCYNRLRGVRDVQLGLIFQGNRETGEWRLHPVDLTANLADVMAVVNAARLLTWSRTKQVTL